MNIYKILSLLKKYKYFLLAFVILVIGYFCMFSEEEVKADEIKKDISEKVEEEKEQIKIKVDIKGAILNPGVYELENNSRVSDAINYAGGLTPEADTSTINLSKNLYDEMVIIVYTKEEIKEAKKGNTVVKYIEKECVCPKIENNACIENEETQSSDSISGKISLNKATLSELMTLTGIGEAKAKAIIEYREKNSGFKSIDELTKVSGIGKSIYDKIKDNITI